MYDYLIVGAGLYGSTFARLATDSGKKCLVIDSRDHIGGNCYTKKLYDVDVHMYGAHIFHTNNYEVWNFINGFTSFNNFINSPKSYCNGRMYSLPFNMNTFYEIWGITTPQQAQRIIESQRFKGTPTNLEEQALSLVGTDIYELLIKNYTIKQWNKEPKDLPAFIINRLPLRFTYDNNYFSDKYQGIPEYGYTEMFENMLQGIDVKLNINYFVDREYWNSISKRVVYTGKIDEFFDYQLGELDYRSLHFEHELHESECNIQGCAVVNYPELDIPWTRIIEHKHFTGVDTEFSVITKEFPSDYDRDKVPYYPINDVRNTELYNRYYELSKLLPNYIFGGRLAQYKYYDMDKTIESAINRFKEEKNINR